MEIKNLKPKVSIIIVNYNNAKFLKKSINSAIKQSYRFLEIIIIDDNSTDNSLEILKKFKNKVILIKNKKKTSEGSYNQINCYYKGYLRSKGEYLFFLDSDDYYKKNKVNLVVEQFKKNKNLEIAFDLPIWKFETRTIKKKFKQKKFVSSNWPRFTPQSCITVKRTFAKEFFKYVRIKKFETIWFDFRVACYSFLKNKNLYIIRKYLTYYRQLDSSASKKFKLFSNNWWHRRYQAHEYVEFLEKKFNIKKKVTIDKLLTKAIFFFND